MNLIPKSLSKQTIKISNNFTLWELLIAIIYLAVAITIGFSLNFLPMLVRVIITIIIFIFLLLTLIPSKKYNMKVYMVIINSFKFFAKKKHYSISSKQENTSFLVPYKRIINNFIETVPLDGGLKWFIGAIEIRGFNIAQLSNAEQQLKISKIHDIFKNLDCEMSLIKIDRPLNLQANINFYHQIIKKIKNLKYQEQISQKGYKSRKEQLQGYINSYDDVNGIIGQYQTSKCFYLVLYHQNFNELIKYINIAERKIYDSGLKAFNLDKYQLVNMIKAIFNPYEKEFSCSYIDQHQENLEKILSLDSIIFKKDYIATNSINYTINAIYDYPLFPHSGWGAQLASSEATMIWNIAKTNKESIKKTLHRAIINANTNIFTTKKIVDKSEQGYQLNAFNQLVEQLATGDEIIKKVNILFLNYGINNDELKKAQLKLQQLGKENNMIIDQLYYRQFEGYSALIPKPTDPLLINFGREMPTLTLAAAFPFINNSLNDSKGLFIGMNTTGDIILYDQFLQNHDRKNFNQLLLGTSGSGKSHTAKKQLNYHIALGRKVIVIDPEREYKALGQYYDGNWIDIGNASNGKINPLQILATFEDNDNVHTNQLIIANHLQFLEHWFHILLPDLTNEELRYLISNINHLYQKFKLYDSHIDQLNNNEFPIITDLLELLKTITVTKNNYHIHNNILTIIESELTGTGKYANLYNYHSTIKLNQNLLTIFDINTIFEKGNQKLIQSQLFLMLAYIQNEVKINRFNNDNEIIILIDEAHLIIDQDNPIGLNFIFQMVKRIRKYRGGIILITQNPDDFLGNETVRKKTMAMMNNTQYTFVLNLSMQNLNDVNQLFKSYGGLSSEESHFIAKAKRGEALFVVSGYNRHCLQVELSNNEIKAFSNKKIKEKNNEKK